MNEDVFDPMGAELPDGGYVLREGASKVHPENLSPRMRAEREEIAGLTYEEILSRMMNKPIIPRPSE